MINKFDSRYQIPDEKTLKTLVVDYFKEKRKNIQEETLKAYKQLTKK